MVEYPKTNGVVGNAVSALGFVGFRDDDDRFTELKVWGTRDKVNYCSFTI